MVLHHALDIKFLDGDDAEPIDQSARLLMNKVVAAVLDALMHTPNNFLRGLPLFRGVLALDLIELALGFGECGFLFTEEARVVNELAIGQSGKGFQPNVNANGLVRRRQGYGLVFAREADVPFSAIPADGTGLDRARAGAVCLGLHLPDFGKRDRALTDTVSALRIGDAVVLIFALQARVARFFTCLNTAEEGLKGEFDTDSDIL